MASSSSVNSSPRPPANLTKETIRVWLGWCTMGDKEVAREAATKGTHIELAIMFISERKKATKDESEAWFKSQILTWIGELLERKQIYKATHVLNNINVNFIDQFSKIFFSTTNDSLREYIGSHLMKLKKLEQNLLELWLFLKLMIKNEVLLLEYKLKSYCIECLDKQSNEWKAKVAVILFLFTYNKDLLPFITANECWNHLIKTRNKRMLLAWINIRNNNEKYDTNINSNLIELFNNLPITNEMLNSNYDSTNRTKIAIYNEFSKFGIFCNLEKNIFQIVLKRLKNSMSLLKLHEILLDSTINEHFYQKLFGYCLNNELFTVLNCFLNNNYCNLIEITSEEEKNTNHLELIKNCQLLNDKFNEENFFENIFGFCKLFSNNDNLINYLESNPIILLALLFFNNNNLKIEDILINKKQSFIVNDLNFDQSLLTVVEKFQILNNFINNKPTTNQITLYNLLERHLKIVNIKNIFKFRYNNELLSYLIFDPTEKPYIKQINYLYYLKQSRPSIASKIYYSLLLDDLINPTILEEKIKKLALTNFDLIEITSACIMFLELINFNSNTLRINLTAAKTILNSGLYDKNFIIDLFLNEKNEEIQLILDDILIEQLQLKILINGNDLIDAIKLSDIVLNFSRINNLKLSESFLKYCALKNLWLPFLLYGQLNNYPLEQLDVMTQLFKSPNLLEHIKHGINNNIQMDYLNKNINLMPRSDPRQYFLSRLGLGMTNNDKLCCSNSIKSKSLSSNNNSLSSSLGNSSSNNSETNSFDNYIDPDILNMKTTLLQILIRCHRGSDPPKALLQACQLYKNPVLAVFASIYEPDSVITNWLTWLSVSCNLCQAFTNYESISRCSILVGNLLEDCLKNGYIKTLMESFQIFLPENPFRYFMEFLYNLNKYNFNEELLKQQLQQFKKILKRIHRNSSLINNNNNDDDEDNEFSYLKNSLWYEMNALHLLSAYLEFNCNSIYEQIIQIEMLCKLKLRNYFTIDNCPNFEKLLEILKKLQQTKTNKIRLNITIFFNNQNYRQAIINCINLLIEANFYEIALEIGQIENLPADLILINQWQFKFNQQNQLKDLNFWLTSNEIFKKYNITADCVIEFYLNCYEKIENNYEKFQILKLSCEWSIRFDLSTKYDLEIKMWLAYLNLENNEKLLVLEECLELSKFTRFIYKDVLDNLQTIPINDYEDLSNEKQNEINKVLIYSLNHNNFWLALKLEKMFNCKCNDMSNLKLCYSLAEGILMPYELNTEQRLFITNSISPIRTYSMRRRVLLSNRFTQHNLSSSSPISDSLEIQQMNDTLTILKSLSDRIINGKELSQNIFMTYRISLNIEIPYQVVVATINSTKLLKDALDDGCMNKLDVVHDFIYVYKWTKNEIAEFLCEEMINAVMNYIYLNNLNNTKEIFLMWDLDLDFEFHLILQLLYDNCSILGYKIYSYANVLHKTQLISTTKQTIQNQNNNLCVVIELLIRAHDCFTIDCNMEGITLILKKCQNVISNLLLLENWKLIVRLLIGIGRYTEMNYVFQILNENNHFEFLLRKGSRKDNALKLALLEYLKKYCPENRDLYKIVALHFTLFSEVALLWEREAQHIINNLITISKLEMQNNKLNPDNEIYVFLTNTEGTKICLNKAMENYAHSTEFHLQGEKLSKAMNSARQAELVALQLSLLKNLPIGGTAICILNITTEQITNLITTIIDFEQTLIVIEAYNYHADWATILYEQYFIRNNLQYFETFLQHFSLTDSLVHDISRKFINTTNMNSLNEIRCMKNILNNLPSIHMKYRIASELGFTDLLEDLIESDQLVYLKDTVWKKGYKN